jgi:hypothetical protein
MLLSHLPEWRGVRPVLDPRIPVTGPVVRPGGADELIAALRIHHPIMRSETGPFSGCRCGQVRLGQDVIAHVVAELRDALTREARR